MQANNNAAAIPGLKRQVTTHLLGAKGLYQILNSRDWANGDDATAAIPFSEAEAAGRLVDELIRDDHFVSLSVAADVRSLLERYRFSLVAEGCSFQVREVDALLAKIEARYRG